MGVASDTPRKEFEQGHGLLDTLASVDSADKVREYLPRPCERSRPCFTALVKYWPWMSLGSLAAPLHSLPSISSRVNSDRPRYSSKVLAENKNLGDSIFPPLFDNSAGVCSLPSTDLGIGSRISSLILEAGTREWSLHPRVELYQLVLDEIVRALDLYLVLAMPYLNLVHVCSLFLLFPLVPPSTYRIVSGVLTIVRQDSSGDG